MKKRVTVWKRIRREVGPYGRIGRPVEEVLETLGTPSEIFRKEFKGNKVLNSTGFRISNHEVKV